MNLTYKQGRLTASRPKARIDGGGAELQKSGPFRPQKWNFFNVKIWSGALATGLAARILFYLLFFLQK